MEVRSCWRATFRFSSIWSGGLGGCNRVSLHTEGEVLTKQLNVHLLECVRAAELVGRMLVPTISAWCQSDWNTVPKPKPR